MNISGLNINGGAVARPDQPRRQVRQRTFESKCNDSEGKERTATRNEAAALQRKNEGVDESIFMLDKHSSDCSHDIRRFGYRQQLESEKENAREACGVSRAKYCCAALKQSVPPPFPTGIKATDVVAGQALHSAFPHSATSGDLAGLAHSSCLERRLTRHRLGGAQPCPGCCALSPL